MIYVARVVYVSHGPVSRNHHGLQPQIPVSIQLGDPIIRLNIKLHTEGRGLDPFEERIQCSPRHLITRAYPAMAVRFLVLC